EFSRAAEAVVCEASADTEAAFADRNACHALMPLAMAAIMPTAAISRCVPVDLGGGGMTGQFLSRFNRSVSVIIGSVVCPRRSAISTRSCFVAIGRSFGAGPAGEGSLH